MEEEWEEATELDDEDPEQRWLVRHQAQPVKEYADVPICAA